MAHTVIVGAGIAGMPLALELRKTLGRKERITVVSATGHFQFVPSNPWVAIGWRKRPGTTTALAPPLKKRAVHLLDHAEQCRTAYEALLKNPGPIVVGAAQGASCFGPAYEFAFILDRDLRKRGLRDQVPITFVTSEPYVGHLGLGGVGDSKGMMEHELRDRDIPWICNASVEKVEADRVHVAEHNAKGDISQQREIPADFSMILPAFKGVDAVARVEGLCNPKGFVQIDEYQRNSQWPNIYASGVCVAIPPVEKTPVATGAPKTGYMIESMNSAIAENIRLAMAGEKPEARATWNALCLADMGKTGAAFLAMPQMPPRNVTWTKKGRWVHWAKVVYERYFLRKISKGTAEPAYDSRACL